MTRIGISLGDPSGIGPEIVARALTHISEAERKHVVVFGDPALLERGFQSQALSPVAVSTQTRSRVNPRDIEWGTPSLASGQAQVDYLEDAVRAATGGQIAALVTAPISKFSAARAGFSFAGHTEFLAERLAAKNVAMFFCAPAFRVVLATVHVALSEVPRLLTTERIITVSTLAIQALMADHGVERPTIGVLGLNPHAGEGDMFGAEERETIAPAVDALRQRWGDRARIEGPLSPDTAYTQPFDLYVAMYHDQALIPVKLNHFDDAVNVTLGLPIVRTSPDHGVAHDIAGKGVARVEPFLAALNYAQTVLAATR